jgi:predicted transcriptional regulator
MNIEARKISLAQRLFMVQQESMLDKIDELLNQKIKLTVAEKKAIDIGLESLENGRRIPHDEVMEKAKNKYPNLFK